MRSIRMVVLALLVTVLTGAIGPGAATPAAAQSGPEPVSLALPTEAEFASDALRAVDDEPDAGPLVVDLVAVEEAALAAAAALPPADWETPSLAAALDYDPMAAFAFVRDSIAFDPYRGRLRGAHGTLAARAGNAVDRALLLGDILEEMQVTTRFAFGRLDEATAAATVERAFLRPAMPMPSGASEKRAGVDAIAGRARRDHALLRAALGDRLDAVDGSSVAAAQRDVADHVWLQMEWGPGWLDLDPTFPDAQPGTTIVPADETAWELPETLGHQVDLVLVAELLEGGTLVERTVLEHTLDAHHASRSDIFLALRPELPALTTSIQAALTGTSQWLPSLHIGSEAVDGQAFPVRPGSDLFGEEQVGPELTALRLRVTTRSPDGLEEARTRVLFDRVPREVRERSALTRADLDPLTERDGLPDVGGTVHQLLVSTGGLSPRSNALGRAFAARWTAAMLLYPDGMSAYALPDQLRPLAVGNDLLVLGSERLVRDALDQGADVRAFVSRPRVYLVSVGPALGMPGMDVSIDLLLDPVRVIVTGARSGADAAALQVWYGALASALETQFGMGVAVLGGPSTRRQAGVSLVMGEPLTVLSAADGDAPPDGADPALMADLASGASVIVPGDATTATSWWTVSLDDGATRAVLSPGLGGSWNHINATPNGGPRYRIPDLPKDQVKNYFDDAVRDALREDAKKEAAKAAKRAPPRMTCVASIEYTVTQCVWQMVVRTLAIGLGVAIVAGILFGALYMAFV